VGAPAAPRPRGSGSSRSRCRGTRRPGGGRPRRCEASSLRCRWSYSSLDEGQPVLADLELVAVLELLVVDPAAVDEGALQRALVLDEEVSVPLDEHGVVARDCDVVEEDVAVRRAADARALAAGPEALPRSAAARPDDERRSFEPLDGISRELADLLRRERLRRLHTRLAFLQQGTAARAVVRGFGSLQAAFRAVKLTQPLAPVSFDERRVRTPAR